MKSIFKKNNKTVLWIAVASMAVIAGGVLGLICQRRDDHEQMMDDHDYLDRVNNKAKRKSRTDVRELHHLVPGAHEKGQQD